MAARAHHVCFMTVKGGDQRLKNVRRNQAIGHRKYHGILLLDMRSHVMSVGSRCIRKSRR